MWSPDSGESADTDALPAPDQSQEEEEEEEAVPIDIPQNELAVNSKAPTMVPSETEAANHQSLMAPPPHATGTAASSEEIEIRDNEDAGFIKDTDDDDDDDNESKPPEVFSDEPEEGTKQKKRFRSKMPFGSSKFKQNNPNHRKKSSCWSSDEGAGITEPYRLARRKQKNLSSNPELEAPMPPATDSAGVGFASRNRKPKSKRRLGKNHAEGSESSEHSSSLEEYQTSTPVHTSQRKAPHTLNSASKSGVDEFPSTVEIRAPGTNSNHFSSSKKKRQSSSSVASAPPAFKKVPLHLSIEDMEICQRLDDEYENALEEREIGYMARYTSVRQAACFSVAFMLLFLFVGTNFFMRYSEWSVHDSLLFSIYTITTVGYGHISIPNTWGFQVYVILYIIVGIATLTIMVAQVYQCIALEASRAQHSRDKSEMARRGLGDVLTAREILLQQRRNNNAQSSEASTHSSANSYTHDEPMFLEDFPFYEKIMEFYENAKIFFTYNEYGRSFSVLFPFAGLILIGAIVVGPIEGWSIIESLYFAVVSLTTVGFGDYYPQHVASIWFCILWLPFSVGFMSMFLKNVATFYIRLSAKNINRIEKRMRKRLARAKERAEQERAEALKRAYRGQEAALAGSPSSASADGARSSAAGAKSSVDSQNGAVITEKRVHTPPRMFQHRNFEAVPTNSEDSESSAPVVRPSRLNLFGSPGDESGVSNRRDRILQNSLEGSRQGNIHRPVGQTMDTMKDVIQAVHSTIESGTESKYLSFRSSVVNLPLGGHSTGASSTIRKPSFALRCLVQERFAKIIAVDIAGYQSGIEIKENTLSVTIDSLRDTAGKWLVPSRALKAFRAVAFEALYFVGEHGLITTGADALFALTPFEFHGLFSPLLAAMGDADTLENWLARTNVLAQVDLKNHDREDDRHDNFVSPTSAAGEAVSGDDDEGDVEMG